MQLPEEIQNAGWCKHIGDDGLLPGSGHGRFFSNTGSGWHVNGQEEGSQP